jgi:hypothetical protein
MCRLLNIQKEICMQTATFFLYVNTGLSKTHSIYAAEGFDSSKVRRPRDIPLHRLL